MIDETMATVTNDREEDYYEEWISLLVGQRDKIGLVILYGMGWQKRESGHSYSFRSGHAFVASMHAYRIIDCVVYSMSYKHVSSNQRIKREREMGVKEDGEVKG